MLLQDGTVEDMERWCCGMDGDDPVRDVCSEEDRDGEGGLINLPHYSGQKTDGVGLASETGTPSAHSASTPGKVMADGPVIKAADRGTSRSSTRAPSTEGTKGEKERLRRSGTEDHRPNDLRKKAPVGSEKRSVVTDGPRIGTEDGASSDGRVPNRSPSGTEGQRPTDSRKKEAPAAPSSETVFRAVGTDGPRNGTEHGASSDNRLPIRSPSATEGEGQPSNSANRRQESRSPPRGLGTKGGRRPAAATVDDVTAWPDPTDRGCENGVPDLGTRNGLCLPMIKYQSRVALRHFTDLFPQSYISHRKILGSIIKWL